VVAVTGWAYGLGSIPAGQDGLVGGEEGCCAGRCGAFAFYNLHTHHLTYAPPHYAPPYYPTTATPARTYLHATMTLHCACLPHTTTTTCTYTFHLCHTHTHGSFLQHAHLMTPPFIFYHVLHTCILAQPVIPDMLGRQFPTTPTPYG